MTDSILDPGALGPGTSALPDAVGLETPPALSDSRCLRGSGPPTLLCEPLPLDPRLTAPTRPHTSTHTDTRARTGTFFPDAAERLGNVHCK